MPREEWSINALAAELQLDRRTLTARLEGLRAVRVKQLKNREERLYRLADVIRHLDRLKAPGQAGAEERERPLKEWVGEQFLPAFLGGDFMYGVIGYLTSELGVDRPRAVKAYLDISVIAVTAVDDMAGGVLQLQLKPGLLLDAMHASAGGTLDAFVAEHWGDR